VNRNANRILLEKPAGNRQLRKPRRRWVEDIKKDLREIGFVGMNWIDLAQDREEWRIFVTTVMNLRVP
jgi:hypothetical protein